MRYLFLLIGLFALTSCSCGWPSWLPTLEYPCSKLPWNCHYNQQMEEAKRTIPLVNTEEVSRVVLTFATQLEHEKFMRLEDSRVYFDSEINTIRLEFITQDILTMREGRELLVDVVEGLLERINNDDILAPDLYQPFTANNLEIYINLESYWSHYGDPFYCGWIVLQDGLAYYYASDIKNRLIDYWHKRVEPYYKSLEFVTISRKAEADYQKSHPVLKENKLKEERYDTTPRQKNSDSLIRTYPISE